MFNIGGPEVLVIALIALVVVGPEQLPTLMRKAGQYASQIRSMTTGLRQEFMAGVEELDPTKWEDSASGERGDGSSRAPIVPRGYAERVAAGEPGNPFSPKPVSQQMSAPSADEAAAEAEAEAEAAAAKAKTAADRAAELRAAADNGAAADKDAASENGSGTPSTDAADDNP